MIVVREDGAWGLGEKCKGMIQKNPHRDEQQYGISRDKGNWER